MKSIFETEINVPQAKLAEFYTNPENNVKWMEDLERCEFIGGELGVPGSRYKFIPKKGNMVFVATIISRDLPNEAKLILESKNVDVLVTAKFIAISPERTKFISEEIFTFKGLFNKAFGFIAQGAVKKAHHKHMKDFEQFIMTIK
jgi:hypothetical protein